MFYLATNNAGKRFSLWLCRAGPVSRKQCISIADQPIDDEPYPFVNSIGRGDQPIQQVKRQHPFGPSIGNESSGIGDDVPAGLAKDASAMPAARWRAMYEHLKRHDVNRWRDDFLAALEEAPAEQARMTG